MKLKRSIFLTLITILLIHPCNVYTEENTKANNIFDTINGQINLTYISSEVDMKNSIITFLGDVDVVGDDMNMSCQKLVLYFNNSLKDVSKEDGKTSIEKIVASESVVFSSSKGMRATAEQAIYYNDTEKIVLTGNPYYYYGDKYEGGGIGAIVTYSIKEEVISVQGTKENKVKGKARIETGKDER
jgi:lipopolysaccharide transport protein LptA